MTTEPSWISSESPNSTDVASSAAVPSASTTEVRRPSLEVTPPIPDAASPIPDAASPIPDAASPIPDAGLPLIDAAPRVAEGLASDVRRQLVARFEAWVDRVAAGEPPPAGLPVEFLSASDDETSDQSPGRDLFSLVATVTNLAGEIRLQGRAFKSLFELLSPLTELPGKVDRLADAVPTAEAESESALPSATAMLELLIDLHDRLARGLATADAAAAVPIETGWFDKLIGRRPATETAAKSVAAVRDGYAMTVSRLTAALHQWDVEPIGRAGEMFDPRRMVAVDVRSDAGVPAGTVVEVNRSGSAVRGSVVMPARVTVAK